MPMKKLLGSAGKAKELLKAKKRLVVYHRDADGVASAALLLKAFPSESFSLDNTNLNAMVLHSIKEKAPELVVFLDLAVDQHWEGIRELEKSSRVLIIDHHLFERDLNSKRTLYINPRIHKKGAYLSASYVVFHLLRKMGKPAEAWISAVGIIGDFAFEQGKDVLDMVGKRLIGKKPRESAIRGAERLISAAITARGEKGAHKSLEALLEAKSFEEFMENEQLQKWKKEIEEELESILKGFEKKREFYSGKKLAILELKSRYSMTSAIATLLGEKHPGLTIIVRKREEDGYSLSLRNQSGKVNLNKILRKACKGIGTGGGHEKAAGAFINDWDEFKKRFLKLL